MEFRYWGYKVIVQPKDIPFFEKLESDSYEKLKLKLKNHIRTLDKLKILFLSSIIMLIPSIIIFYITLMIILIMTSTPNNNFFLKLGFALIISIAISFFIASKKIVPKLKKRFLKEENIIRQAERLKHKEAKKEFFTTKIASIGLYTSTQGLEIIQNLGYIEISSKNKLGLENELRIKAYNSGGNAVINVQYSDSTTSTISSSFNGIGAQRTINTKHKTTYHMTGDLAIININ